MKNKFFKDLGLFGKAFQSTKKEIWISVRLLALITVLFAIAMFLAEHPKNPVFSIWDGIVWTFVKYVEDPAEIVEAPVTLLGKIVGTLVGVLGIAIFAVPAGLIGSGLIDAMEEEKREKELKDFRQRMTKAFRRSGDKALRGYLDSLPDKGGEKYKTLNFVNRRVPVSRLQIRQGLDLKDVFDVCYESPEFKIKNLADAVSEEQQAEDRFVLEHYPVNRPYGYCVNRNSKVTIVATSCYDENGTGWFTYYLAKLGGFNYVCKHIEVDPEELDSYYNFGSGPRYKRKRRSDYDEKKDKEAIAMLDKKEANRKAFLEDLKALAPHEDSWVILVTSLLKSSVNTIDFHFVDSRKDGSESTVHEQQCYQQMFQVFDKIMQSEYQLTSSLNTKEYALKKSNLGYRLKEEGLRCNTFTIRPCCDVINFDRKNLIYAYRMAMLFSEYLDNSKGIEEDDVADFKDVRFGYI